MRNVLTALTDYRQFQIFILGIYSGMPLALIYFTLSTWMAKEGVDIAVITTFAISRIFYSLKFIWAPIIDNIKLPIIHKIGRRKSWMCLISALIALIVFNYSYFNPKESINYIFALTLALGFLSATFDIVIDAYRIDTIDKEDQALAASNAVFGYRIGLFVSNTSALFVANYYGWEFTFFVISCMYMFGSFFMLTLREKECSKKDFKIMSLDSWKTMVISPFYDFFSRKGSVMILLAIIFYKLGDSFLGVVASPFYIDLGFSLAEIGSIVKTFGVVTTILGMYISGAIIYKYGYFKGLIIGGIAQSITNFAFVWLSYQGHDINALIVAIFVENLASGMGDAALVAYLSYLCNKNFSATQYALLSSGSGLFSHSIVVFGGSLAKYLGWAWYFTATVFMAAPGILLLLYLKKKRIIDN